MSAIASAFSPSRWWPWGVWSMLSLGILLLFVAYPIGVLTWNALLDAQGGVLDERAVARGLLSVPAGGWSQVFDQQLGDWLQRWPKLPCLMAGMVGSRQGWEEAPYAACPAPSSPSPTPSPATSTAKKARSLATSPSAQPWSCCYRAEPTASHKSPR